MYTSAEQHFDVDLAIALASSDIHVRRRLGLNV